MVETPAHSDKSVPVSAWDIKQVGADDEDLGTIVESGFGYSVEAAKDTLLAGIDRGPYLSKQAALDAIRAHLRGSCETMLVERPL